MKNIFLILLLFVSTTWGSNLCHSLLHNKQDFEQVHREEYILHPVFCDSDKIMNLNSIDFFIQVPEDVLAYKITVITFFDVVTTEYLNSIVHNDLGVFSDASGSYFMWVEPGSLLDIRIPLDKSKLSFTPISFIVEYEPYLYKQTATP